MTRVSIFKHKYTAGPGDKDTYLVDCIYIVPAGTAEKKFRDSFAKECTRRSDKAEKLTELGVAEIDLAKESEITSQIRTYGLFCSDSPVLLRSVFR